MRIRAGAGKWQQHGWRHIRRLGNWSTGWSCVRRRRQGTENLALDVPLSGHREPLQLTRTGFDKSLSV